MENNIDLQLIPNKIIRIIGELHNRGYQSLYLDCGLSPSGFHWRYAVFTPDTTLFSGSYDATILALSDFNQWVKNWNAPISVLADDFLAHFHDDLQSAKQANQVYAEWFNQAIEYIEETGYFIMFCDFGSDETTCYGDNKTRQTLPLPYHMMKTNFKAF
ncbi:MAG: hypothetical protein Q4B82_04825 [Alysiella sp.]|uniref:hypothetical protein n=1 Tax=Alysiella sp. TaxID=1872483 RepID=UPI0026DA8146|nr:hypothetical protein [Alysiella sp.]MDO4433886.1 hypothetical protein [Alysiella sp.]